MTMLRGRSAVLPGGVSVAGRAAAVRPRRGAERLGVAVPAGAGTRPGDHPGHALAGRAVRPRDAEPGAAQPARRGLGRPGPGAADGWGHPAVAAAARAAA